MIYLRVIAVIINSLRKIRMNSLFSRKIRIPYVVFVPCDDSYVDEGLLDLRIWPRLNLGAGSIAVSKRLSNKMRMSLVGFKMAGQLPSSQQELFLQIDFPAG